MKALEFISLCNRVDDGVYETCDAIVEGINQKLSQFDFHNAATISVDGYTTNRFVKYQVMKSTPETLTAVHNVFSEAGYLVLVERDTQGNATIYVVFDSDVAPGPASEEDGIQPAGDEPGDEGEDPVPEPHDGTEDGEPAPAGSSTGDGRPISGEGEEPGEGEGGEPSKGEGEEPEDGEPEVSGRDMPGTSRRTYP